MKNNDEIPVNEWNQTKSYQGDKSELEHAATELENSYGVLNTPEIVPFAQGRMTDRVSRMSKDLTNF
jgi:thioredoxin-related protein